MGYSIGPVEGPAWRVDAEDFARRLRDRFPDACIRVNELGNALHRNGQFVSLDPADLGVAAGFLGGFAAEHEQT